MLRNYNNLQLRNLYIILYIYFIIITLIERVLGELMFIYYRMLPPCLPCSGYFLPGTFQKLLCQLHLSHHYFILLLKSLDTCPIKYEIFILQAAPHHVYQAGSRSRPLNQGTRAPGHQKKLSRKNYHHKMGLIRDRTGDLLQAVRCTQSKNSTTELSGHNWDC